MTLWELDLWGAVMRSTTVAVSVATILLAGCSTDSRSIRFDTTTGALPANSVPDVIKSEVADQVWRDDQEGNRVKQGENRG
ncbi:MAG: hypothetical protein ACOYLQ_15380, partial [Hyphomicrobiaceae bacterium]